MVSQSPAQWADDAWQVFTEYLQTDRSLMECARGVAEFLRENSALDEFQRQQFYHRLLQKQYPALQALQLAGELAALINQGSSLNVITVEVVPLKPDLTNGPSSPKRGKAPILPLQR
jgi:hypothetical protein